MCLIAYNPAIRNKEINFYFDPFTFTSFQTGIKTCSTLYRTAEYAVFMEKFSLSLH